MKVLEVFCARAAGCTLPPRDYFALIRLRAEAGPLQGPGDRFLVLAPLPGEKRTHVMREHRRLFTDGPGSRHARDCRRAPRTTQYPPRTAFRKPSGWRTPPRPIRHRRRTAIWRPRQIALLRLNFLPLRRANASLSARTTFLPNSRLAAALLLETVFPVPAQEVRMRPVAGAAWQDRSPARVYNRADAVRIVRLARDEDAGVVG